MATPGADERGVQAMRIGWCARVVLLVALIGVPQIRSVGDEPPRVGKSKDGEGSVVPTNQVLRPAGRALVFGGRPVDLALSPDGRRLYAKDNRGLVVIDREEWRVVQELPFPRGGGSMHGIAV